MLCTKCNQQTGAEWKTLCPTCWRSQTPDEIRAYRQQKLDKKIARMRTKVDRLEKEAEGKQAEFNSYRGDIAFMTQPARKSSAFGRQRDKILGKYETGIRLQIEAGEVKEKADWMEKQGVAVKGDAERKRQAKREEQDKTISVGSTVYAIVYGKEGKVTRVNKKTYTVRFSSGFTTTIDKTHVEPIKQ